MKGMNLHNNAQVPVGSDVTIDISSLPRNEPISCDLSPDKTWGNTVHICTTIPTIYPCDPLNSYHGRSTYINATMLQIIGVLKNESGIYRCRRAGPGSTPPIIISGVIIVGMAFSYIYIYFQFILQILFLK